MNSQDRRRLSKSISRTAKRTIYVLTIVCLFFVSFRAGDDLPGSAGTVIVNRAEATYQDDSGTNYNAVSSAVTITILAVSSVAITPDETTPSAVVAPNETITRQFRLCNTGNGEDFFVLTAANVTAPASLSKIYFDADNDNAVGSHETPVVVGQTLTPRLAPGACLGILFVVETNGVAPQTQIALDLTARSTLAIPGTNNFPQDTGKIINSVGSGVSFRSPSDENLPPLKLVENLPRSTVTAGQFLNYKIAFRNKGAVAARQVRVVDQLPAGLEYVGGSMRLNTRQLTDASDADEGAATARSVQLLIPEIAPEALTEILFQARLTADTPNGSGIVNTAQVSAANASQIASSETIAVFNPVGTVYAGNSLGAARIAGAKVIISADQNGAPFDLTPDIGFTPNTKNTSEYITDSNGNFSFALDENQIAANAASSRRCVISVAAPGYRQRLIEVELSRAASGAAGMFKATVHALDGQPVSEAGNFKLTTENVNLENLAALVFNIPMFEFSSLEIAKTSDKQTAEIGEIITYRVTVKNATAYVFRNVSVRDTLPAGFVYADGTAQIQNGLSNQSINPAVSGSELSFPIGDLEAGRNLTISYRVRIGASAAEGEQFNLAQASGTQPNGSIVTTQPAKAGVRVRGGVFSMRQVVIGRVYEDLNFNGQFDEGERAVSGARIYLNNGQSVITDSAGQYNIPAVGQGSLVLSLDPVTIPQDYFLADDDNRRSSKSWTRLLQTPLGGGSLLRQNFAIAPLNQTAVFEKSAKVIDVNINGNPRIPKTSSPEVKNAVQVASTDTKNSLGLPPNAADTKKTGKDKSETFTVETTETIEPVAAGNIAILSPKMSELVMAPALSIKTRVAKGWTVKAEVNGETISSSNIGETRVDNRNQVTTYSFVGINVRPGENTIRMTAVSPDGSLGKTEEIKVLGRGATERLEIVPSKNQTRSGGRETVAVEIRAFDRWGNPAADGQIAVETSAGYFVVKQNAENPAETPELPRRQAVSLENGLAIVQIVSSGAAETARLKAVSGKFEATGDIRFTPELRPQILVGMGELSFGRNAPSITTSGKDANFHSRFSLYFRGQIFGSKNLLTLAYDSHKPLNRVAGRDRFGDFDPLDRAYPIFGDSSQRFEDAQSNSKLYARIDRGNSYAMFGDMETDQQDLSLAGYSRRLTGVKVHLENSRGDFVSVTGARPDTAFARDVFPGGNLSLVRLSHVDLLPGSEVVNLEIRDRRNPEIILKRETLIRSVDYNIDSARGEIFFLRPVSTFDYLLNLVQVVATYEYRGTGASSAVYTGRAVKTFNTLGLRFGASYVNQQQADIGAFQVGGIDAEKTLWNSGKFTFEAAFSDGRFASGVNIFDADDRSDASRAHNGMAFRARLEQPLPFWQSRLRADFSHSSRNFFNPFGATIAPGAQRLQIDLEMRPSVNRSFVLGYTDERNETRNVSNSRSTISALWSEVWNNQLRTTLGFDRRSLTDNLTDKTIDSNLLTAGIEYRPTDKIEIAVKREQNLTEADPTYPNQTIFSLNYALNSNAKLFLTQRLAAAAITPIGDFSGGGFSSTGSRNETAIGIETKIARLGALNGRYQLENGANGMDSFAVIGLQNTWSVTKQFALEGGFERGFAVAGEGKSFNSATVGGAWTPIEDFRATARYELRNRNGLGQLLTVGAAGRIGDNWTTLVRGQWGVNVFDARRSSLSNLTAAGAYRPLRSDKYALLFSYNRRETSQGESIVNGVRQSAVRDRSDSLSADGLYQAKRDLEIYGRFALRFNGNGDGTTPYASALTFLGQVRAQQRINDYFDVAAEGRWIAQPASATFRRSFGAELGYWATSDLRLGLGYNFTQSGLAASPLTANNRQFRGGFYFTITTKLSNMFNLFGTSRSNLQNQVEQEKEEPKNAATQK